MGTERSGFAGLPEGTRAGPGNVTAIGGGAYEARLARLEAELEQAHVTLEDADQRISQFVAANAELTDRLEQEARLRRQAELRVKKLLADRAKPLPQSEPRPSEEALLREQLSIAMEELQVMQEELEVVHQALQRAEKAES